jgi:tankyrase
MDLFEACKVGDLAEVKKLIDTNSVNLRDSTGRKSTPLHFAAGFGRCEVVDYLLTEGAKVDAQDDGGLIPLHNACSFGHAEVVNVLLKHGADPNARDNWNYTPLHEAAHKGKVNVCITLLQNGGDPVIRNTDGKTPYDLADISTKAVLSGDYRREELLEAAKQGNDEKMISLLTPLNVNCHAGDGRKSTPLHLAAGFNRVNIVRTLLKHGADVHAKDKGGLVPLHNACSYGHYEVVELLVTHGAQVNAVDLWQFTPMHEAASKARKEVCTLLLCHGADPYILNCHAKSAIDLAPTEMQDSIDHEFRGLSLLSAATHADVAQIKKLVSLKPDIIHFQHPMTNDTALHHAVLSEAPKRKATVELLIKKKADLNAQNKELLTPLHCATDKAHMDALEILIKHGANVNLQDKNGLTVLHIAAKQGLHNIFRYLLSHGADITVQTTQGETMEDLATPSVRKVIQEEVSKPNPSTHSRILEAAKNGDFETLKLLVSRDNVNCRDTEGRNSTPLHFAAGYNRIKVVEFLVSMGAKVSAKDKGGLVPLHNACSYGHYEVAKLLITNNAEVGAKDHWGYTPLHEAAAKGKFEICKLLVENGASVTTKNRESQTPFDLLKDKEGDLADLLQGPRALLDAAKKGDLERVKKLTNKSNLNCQDEQGRNSTPLHLAAGYNHVSVAEFLIQQGADVNARDKGGLIPLHNASSYGHLDVAQLLIVSQSEINAVDRWRFTPLHEAAQKGRAQLCSLLIMSGADVQVKNQDSHTPLDIALGEDVKALLTAAMKNSLDPDHIVTQPGSRSVSYQVTPAATSLLQETPVAVPSGVNVDQPKSGLDAVLDMLKSMDLGDYCEVFRKERITLDVLVDMDHDALKEIGVDAYGSRHKIIKKSKEVASAIEMRQVDSLPSRPAGEDSKLVVTPLPPSNQKYINVEEMMQRTVRSHQGSAGGIFTSYSIIKIEHIHNPKLWKKHLYTKGEIAEANGGDANEMMLFHGSPYVHNIIQNGFDERHACSTGMFGAGIYFAHDSSKSNQYVYGISSRGCTAHSERSCYECERVLLLCRVLLGKSHKQTSAQRLSHAPPGHNSVSGVPTEGGLCYKEYVIYRGEQAYPEYLISYKIVAPDGKD